MTNYYPKSEVNTIVSGNISTVRTEIESNFTLLDETKFNISDYQRSFNLNISNVGVGNFSFTDYQGSFNTNLSGLVIGNFSFIDFQNSFNINSTEAEFLSSTELNNTYANLSRTINEANISDLTHTSAGNLSWNELKYKQEFQGDFNSNVTGAELISSTVGNSTYRNLSSTINEANISDLSHTIDTNETKRFQNLTSYTCQGTSKMIGVELNGTITCGSVAGGGDFSFTDYQTSFNLNFSDESIGDFSFSNYQASFNLNISDIGVGNFSFIDYQNSFNLNISDATIGNFSFQDYQSSFNLNISDLGVGNFSFTNFQASFDLNFSDESIADFSFTDFQGSFDSNTTGAELISSTTANLTYANLSRTISKGNLTNIGTLTFDWVNSEIADAISIIGGILGANSVSGLWTTTGTWTLGDDGDRIDIASDTWDVANGVMSGVTTLDTGQGANELYDMDQNVLEASNVNFAFINSTGNITLGDDNVIQEFNGTCLNTYVQGTLVESIGCV